MKYAEMASGLLSLAIFKNLRSDAVIKSLSALFSAGSATEAAAAMCDVAGVLYPHGGDITSYILDAVLKDENFYIRNRAGGLPTPKEADTWLMEELRLLSAAASVDSAHVASDFGISWAVPQWTASTVDFETLYSERLYKAAVEGFGIFYKHRAFSMGEDGELIPVRNPDAQRLDELYGYRMERENVIQNTRALLSGLPASNILLYGDAGTGKSSTVKAVAAEFAEDGLRLIQIEKSLLHTIPALLDELSDNPLKFILFIDDLSFVCDDRDFTALKTVLEGSVASRPKNIVVYATSNRRHLINETFEARRGDEVHLNDTLEEVSSLSARFGMVITFGKPDKDLYTTVVHELATHCGLSVPEDVLIREAEAFAIRAGGRSPRAARQFVEHKLSMSKLQQ